MGIRVKCTKGTRDIPWAAHALCPDHIVGVATWLRYSLRAERAPAFDYTGSASAARSAEATTDTRGRTAAARTCENDKVR